MSGLRPFVTFIVRFFAIKNTGLIPLLLCFCYTFYGSKAPKAFILMFQKYYNVTPTGFIKFVCLFYYNNTAPTGQII